MIYPFLKFRGPFHWEHINNVANNRLFDISLYENLKKSNGVYIWGFMFDIGKKIINTKSDYNISNIPLIKDCQNNNELIGYNYNSKKIFIPYYVGRAKESNNIGKRLDDHHKIGATYTRLEEFYYYSFFCDEDFPLPIKKGDWISSKEFKRKIMFCINYFNNEHVLEKCYPNSNPVKLNGNCPVDLQTFIKYDTLKDIVISRNNFWFCYLDMNGYSGKLIDIAERQTFYSLKGKTVSNTDKFDSIKFDLEFDSTKSCEGIFKTKGKRIISNTEFKGY